MRIITIALLTALALSACGSDNDPAATETSRLCSGECPLRIEPQQLVLGMPADSSTVAAQALWAVHANDDLDHPVYLSEEATWTTSDPSVAEVDTNGVVQPVAPGAAWIAADYGDERAWAQVTVAGSIYTSSLPSDSGTRHYMLYVPDGPAPGSGWPLVIGLHGGGGQAENQIRMSQINSLAHTERFVAAYPEGTSLLLPLLTWNGGSCCGNAASQGVDDVGFIRQLVAELATNSFVDTHRVYATGMSNGAIMTHRLACEAADVFAAVAPVAGGLNVGGDFPACAPSRPVPVMMFHGTTDRNYPIEGGDGSGGLGVPESFYPVVHPTEPDTLGDWRRINDALGSPRRSYSEGAAHCDTYSGNAPVVMCIIDPETAVAENDVVYDGGGHAWPGGVRSLNGAADAPSRDIDASEMMWQFFSQHRLP